MSTQDQTMPPSPPCCYKCRNPVVRRGSFYRTSDDVRVQRYYCRQCGSSFSEATGSPCFQHKKRQLHGRILEGLCSGVSQRRLVRMIQVNRKTIASKLTFLGERALQFIKEENNKLGKLRSIQFDDVETVEHTKCKPLSIAMAVVADKRWILGFRVASMPAKGPLAEISRKKYGPRPDDRGPARRDLFAELKPLLADYAEVRTDMNPHYQADISAAFPSATHTTFKGRRGCVVGQGELKKIGFDPLFSFNHTAAMLRANINRLFRRTWCLTKKPSCLESHLAIYALYHNVILLKPTDPPQGEPQPKVSLSTLISLIS